MMSAVSSPALSSSPKAHLDYLDGLRALAALFVVVHHAFLQVWPRPEMMTDAASSLATVLWHGHYAVDLFIVLSGFCLMFPVTKAEGVVRGGALNFYLRRAWRILPPYWLAMLLSLVLIWTCIGTKSGTHWDVSLPVTVKGIVTHIFMAHDAYAQDYTINHAFWSIAVEWRIYFLFPLMVWAARRYGMLKMTVLAVVVSCALYDPVGRRIAHSLTVHYVGLFAMGMFAAQVAFGRDAWAARLRALPWLTMGVLTAVTAVMLSLNVKQSGGELPLYLEDSAVGLVSMALLIAVARCGSFWLTRALGWRPLVFIGGFSYSLYLIHSPLLEVLQRYAFAPLQGDAMGMFLALVIVGTPVIVLLSYGFYLVAERPFTSRCPVQVPQAGVPAEVAA